MKYIISLLLLVGALGQVQAQCSQCETLFGCLELEVRSGKSSTINSNSPVNLRELFNIKGRTPEILMSDPTITWWFVDQAGNIRSVSNNNPSATAYNFKLAEWGKVEVYVTLTCITGGPKKTSTSAFIEVLDYGIYFYAANSTHAGNLPWKFRNSEASTVSTNFFDRNRPTIIYVAGWNKGSVAAKSRGRLLDNTGQNMIAYWRNKGWNVGIFHWNQFSDELNPADPEGKMYNSEGLEQLVYGNRKNWKRSDGSLTREVAPDSNIVKIFLQAYYNVKSNLLGNGKELRMAGHSLGAELICLAMAEATPNAFLPNRVALLDPWWTVDRQNNYKDALLKLASANVALEWYTSSNLQNMSAAISNVPLFPVGMTGWRLVKKFLDLAQQQGNYQVMLNTAARVSLNPKFVTVTPLDPIGNLTNEHSAAVWWYFTSIQSQPPALCVNPSYQLFDDGEADMTDDEKKIPMMITGSSGISAASCQADIIVHRGNHFLHTNGTKTLTAADDTLLQNEMIIFGRKPLPFSREKLQESTGTSTTSRSAPIAGRSSPDLLTTPLPLATNKNQVTISQAAAQAGSPISYYNIYSFDEGYPIATGWHTSRAWRGTVERRSWTDGRSGDSQFLPSKAQSATFAAVKTKDYDCSGFDRGHVTPSADRNLLVQEMGDTYFMNNMIPMNPKQNQHWMWRKLEKYLAEDMVGKTLNKKGVATGRNLEVFVFAGALPPTTTTNPLLLGSNNAGVGKEKFDNVARIKVPGRLWKVVLFHIPDQPFDLANTNMLAVLFPNRIDAGADWTTQIVKVDDIEQLTGYNFFDKLDDVVENKLEGDLFNALFYVAYADQLEPGESREAKACRSMSLTPGFNAAQGSRFRGYIDPNCGTVARTAKAKTAPPPPSNFTVLPNPATHEATIRFSGKDMAANEVATLVVTDMQGRTLLQTSTTVLKGNNQLRLNIARYAAGTYLVQLRTKAQTFTTKLVKQ
jgi:DNA/RNA endonuclease G (NUC1)